MDYIKWIYGKIASFIQYLKYHEDDFKIIEVKTIHHQVEITRDESYMATEYVYGSQTDFRGFRHTTMSPVMVQKTRSVGTGMYRYYDSYDIIGEDGKTFKTNTYVDSEKIKGCILKYRVYYVIWTNMTITSADGEQVIPEKKMN